MNPITISALTTHIVALFERDDQLRDVAVVGEVSNWKRAASGHIYFSLKDSGASIAAVMWRGNAASQTWLPRAGDQVIAYGYVGVYPERGAYQLYVNRMQPAGRGQLYVQFEQLKAQLEQEGLFDPERKRALPPVPVRIGIVTSPDAAALRDILHVLDARWPLVDVVVFPTLVQGSEAPGQIADMVRTANRYATDVEPLDVLIVARGGGSIEDLWAFNDERVAYAVAESTLPVIAGVGHETDFTIVDFVADVRAPTPSAAAAAVVPDRNEALARLLAYQQWVASDAAQLLGQYRRQLREATNRLGRLHPQRQLDLQRQRLEDRIARLHGGMARRMERSRDRADAAQQKLDALNPTRVLGRGYSIVQRADGNVVRGPVGLSVGERLSVSAADGSYGVTVLAARDQDGVEGADEV